MNETRTLKVDPHLIFDVISKQSGTLSKAAMEGVMNSIDAGATQCNIELSSDDLTISDDGKGFVGREEIERFFETFGTPHVKGDAVLGKFRIGRGQIMSWGHNKWRSGAFYMDVDLKKRGLDYTLRETPDDIQKGCSILVNFYDRLSPGDFDATLREIKDLVAYSPIPVTLNGVLASKNRSSIKWDHEDDKCLIAFRSAGQVKLYNLGMYVRDYSASQHGGSPAIVVSKEQVEVNFARTDVLVNQCEVWRHVRKVLDRYARERGDKKTTRTTPEDRQYRLQQFLFGEMLFSDVRREKLLPLFPSGFTSIDSLLDACVYRQGLPLVTLGAHDNDRIAEAVLRGQRARVLRKEALEWVGVETAGELVEALACGVEHPVNGRNTQIGKTLRRIKTKTLVEAGSGLMGSHSVIHSKEWTALEGSIVAGLDAAQQVIRNQIKQVEELVEWPKTRRIQIGLSDTALAWTDGKEFITFERRFVNEKIKTLGGVCELVGTLLHELIHDDDDSGSHLHDMVFFERFHDLMLGGSMQAQRNFISRFHAVCRSRKGQIPAQLRRDLDAIFALTTVPVSEEEESLSV